MFEIFRRGIIADLLNGRVTAVDFYNRLSTTVLLAVLAVLTASFVADVAGQNWFQIVLIPVWMGVMMYVKYHVDAIIASLSIGGAAAVANRESLVSGMREGWKKWERFMNHAALFGGVFGLTRFLVPIKAYPFMGLVLLGALLTLGMWAWTFKTVAGTFTGRPEQPPTPPSPPVQGGISPSTNHPAAPMTTSAKSAIKSMKKEVTNLFTDEWKVVARVDCEVANTPGGWCSAGVHPAGTYRVVVKYDTVGIQQQDGKVHRIPPEGVNILDFWGNSPEFVEVFQKNAPIKNLRIAGLVGRASDGKMFDPTGAQGRFEQEVDGPVQFTANLPQNEPFYRQVRGVLRVDLEKLVE